MWLLQLTQNLLSDDLAHRHCHSVCHFVWWSGDVALGGWKNEKGSNKKGSRMGIGGRNATAGQTGSGTQTLGSESTISQRYIVREKTNCCIS